MKTQQLKLFETPSVRLPERTARTWFDRMREAVNNAPEPERITHLQRRKDACRKGDQP